MAWRRRLSSIFWPEISYNLSRPFPQNSKWWFRVSVYGLSVVLVGVFTLFNIAANAYSLNPVYTSDPNTTIAHNYWFNHFVFTLGDAKLAPTCQSMDIPVGYQFLTSNSGFTHTVQSVVFNQGSLPPQSRGVISYSNNTLENCRVDNVVVNLKKSSASMPGPGETDWWSWAESFATAQSSCEVYTLDGTYTLSFQATYPGDDLSFAYLAESNYTSKASMWWGSRIMNNYFLGIQYVMTRVLSPGNSSYTSAQMTFSSQNATSIQGNSMFSLDYWFLSNDGGITNTANEGKYNGSLYDDSGFVVSTALTEGLFFAKAMSSLVLVDLGSTSGAPNLLLDATSLQYALSTPDDFNRQSGAILSSTSVLDWWKFNGIPEPGALYSGGSSKALPQAYAAFSSKAGPLGTQPSRLYAQYICSVPQRKGKITIILLVVIADIVLMQAAWGIFGIIWGFALTSRDPTGGYCEGCLQEIKPRGVEIVGGDEKGAYARVNPLRQSNSSGHTLLLGPEREYEGDG